jgi:hypothetical protein
MSDPSAFLQRFNTSVFLGTCSVCGWKPRVVSCRNFVRGRAAGKNKRWVTAECGCGEYLCRLSKSQADLLVWLSKNLADGK